MPGPRLAVGSEPAAEAAAVGPRTVDGAVAVVDPNSDSQSLPVLHMLIGCPTQTAPAPNLGEKASFFEAKGRFATVFGIAAVVFRCHGFRSRARRAVRRARVPTRRLMYTGTASRSDVARDCFVNVSCALAVRFRSSLLARSA